MDVRSPVSRLCTDQNSAGCWHELKDFANTFLPIAGAFQVAVNSFSWRIDLTRETHQYMYLKSIISCQTQRYYHASDITHENPR